MDTVEILLLGIVGLSVLFFLILDNLDPHREGLKQSGKARIEESEVLERECLEERKEERECLEERKEEREVSDSGEVEEEFIDDWEGVERSELEKIFGEAMVFVNSKMNNNNGDGIGEDVKLQLYGLERAALDGPCYGSQPMALQVSARSKWSAWHKLGNMNPEMAMEKYIDILSEAIPEWKVNENLRSKDKISLTGQDMVTSKDTSDDLDEAEVER